MKARNAFASLLIAFGFILVPAYLYGQATSGSTDQIPQSPDQMFQSPDMIETAPAAPSGGGTATPGTAAAPAQPSTVQSAAKPASPTDAFLTSKGVTIGGTLYSEFTEVVQWYQDYPTLSNLSAGESDYLVPKLEGDIYFDARPYDYFRVFGKVKAIYPFTGSSSQAGLSPTQFSTNLASAPNVNLFELYADFSYRDSIYFRAGKQVMTWGVGYFFSPADVISLVPINPQQPNLEREGPLALKVSIPYASVDNLYLYAIMNPAFQEGGVFHIDDLAYAAKTEFLVGDYELGVGGYFQRTQRPKLMATATGSLWKLNLFGEAVLSYGRDANLVVAAPLVPPLYVAVGPADTTTPYFSGTVGASYTNADLNLNLFGQYYYNGQGYADGATEEAAIKLYHYQLAQLSGGVTPPGTLL
ncbi:MAG TPA: hypothetical protein VMW73_16605, partial [Spirochaetia bacterium]|nr:hypothetical protein [Spirochaetia bacterium]